MGKAAPSAVDEQPELTNFALAFDIKWRVSEVAFRVEAARSLLVHARGYDERDLDMLGVDFVLTALRKQIDQLGDELTEVEGRHA